MLDTGRIILISGLLIVLTGLVDVLRGAILSHQSKDISKSTPKNSASKNTPPPGLCAKSAFVLKYRDHNGDLTGRYDFGLIRSDLRIYLLTNNTVWFYDYSDYSRSDNENTRYTLISENHARLYSDPEYQEKLRVVTLKEKFSTGKYADVEWFGDTQSVKSKHHQRFLEDGSRLTIQWSQEGDFHWINTNMRLHGGTNYDGSITWLGALKAIGALNTQEDLLSLYHLASCPDRKVSTGSSTGDLHLLIGEANYDLDRKMINAIRSLMVTALMRRNLISGISEADVTLESANQTLTRKEENSPAGVEAKRLRDRAARTKTVLSDSLSLVKEQERRIMACIERVREYKIQVNDRSAEALVAAEAGKAATDAVEMTIRLTGGMTSREEVDSDSILVTSIVQELETRISAFNALVKQIRTDTSLDTDTAGISVPMEHQQSGS